jgi:hypothetical protein
MAKYKVVKQINFGAGFFHDKNGNPVAMQSFAPKIGDIIELGELKERTLWNSAPTQGFDFIVHQEGVTPDGMLWILADAVEKVPDSTRITNTTNKSSSKSLLTSRNLIIGTLIIGAIICGLKLSKVF